MPSHLDFNIERRPWEVYPASRVTGHADTTAYYFEDIILTATLAAKIHMHKVFSANRAVLCLDGTHCSALSLHVCLRVPQFLFRLSCRADTPQTHRPTRIHKHNKQWRLSSSSFIPRPKHTHTRAVTQMHPYTHKNSLSLRNANAKNSECCPV